MNKRIGFLLASIHGGMAPKMWKSAIEAADLSSSSIFFFPGGRLNRDVDDEYLRNGIYPLASKKNLDGLIAWSSSLAGDASPDEVKDYMDSFSNLPLVSIGLRCRKAPLVDFDAYQGMADEVRHFINVHHSRRIAFIRGPENHSSAQERYQAYLDCLKNASISIDHDLISSPRPWSEGRQALEELISERGLVPGIDFDTLVCASDMLLYGAAKYLDELGVDVPGTLRVGGFNDSDTNKLLPVSISTVRMPIARMTRTALSLLSDMMEEGSSSGPDVNLQADFIIRSSCGCAYASGDTSHQGAFINTKDEFISWASALANLSTSGKHLRSYVDNALSLGERITSAELDFFVEETRKLCNVYFMHGGDCEDLIEIFNVFYHRLPLSAALREYCEKNLESIIFRCYVHFTGSSGYRREEEELKLSAFKTALLSMRSLDHLSDVLFEYLPKLGFMQAYLVLDANDDAYMHLSSGYDRYERRSESVLFPSGMILPDGVMPSVSDGAYVVEPLFSDSQVLGYLVLEVTSSTSGQLLEDIRSSVSSALKGISLLEIANRARESAEKAERTSSEFYANISEELREPLVELRAGIDHIPSSAKYELLNQIVKAENLLDLILSEKGEMELKKSLIDPSSLFSELAFKYGFSQSVPSELPLLYADEDRIRQVAEILSFLVKGNDGFNAALAVAVRPDGLSISFSAEGWRPSLLRNNPSLILAEKIVMMHGGSFRFREQGLILILPWPSLSGEAVSVSSIGYTLYIGHEGSDRVPEVIRSLPQVIYTTDTELSHQFNIGENVCQIAYDAEDGGEKGGIVLTLLRNHQKTRRLPFLCFSLPPSSLDLWSALETRSPDSGSGTIVVLGSLPESLKRFSSFGSFVYCSSREELLSAKNGNASLVILDTADPVFLGEIRVRKEYAKATVLIVKDHFAKGEIEAVAQKPLLLVANTCILECDEFVSRLIGIFGGNELLPPLTGALVKRSIAYLNEKASSQLSRWQLAEAVNISEDYLTRIFRKDMGISPWDYLNRYRIQIASELLTQSGATINEIASRSGFQDQAYFCRVFKKIKGFPPGKMRKGR